MTFIQFLQPPAAALVPAVKQQPPPLIRMKRTPLDFVVYALEPLLEQTASKKGTPPLARSEIKCTVNSQQDRFS
jgi:hypothetical protein